MRNDELARLISELEAMADDAALCARAEYFPEGEPLRLSELKAEPIGERHLIGHVRAGDPPPGITLAEWIEWRKREDVRMQDELLAQVAAYDERMAGVTLH